MGKKFKQSVSYKVFIHHEPNADGWASLLLRVIIDRKKKEFGLNESWPTSFFDKKNQVALQRFSGDNDVDPLNMIITEAKSKANLLLDKITLPPTICAADL
jgi:hypothetical protein